MALNALKKIDNALLSFFEINATSKARQYIRVLSYGGILAILLALFYWVYSTYSTGREQNAQRALASCIELYEQAAESQAQWPSVVAACEVGYQEYRRSSLAPYFLSYQAEALIKQSKTDDAIKVMTLMVGSMFKTYPLYYIYSTKLALLQMDSTESAVHAAGLKRLEELAADNKNEQRDEALYYVGLYNWQHNDMAKAKEAWKQLANLPSKNQDQASPWMQLVAERLQFLV